LINLFQPQPVAQDMKIQRECRDDQMVQLADEAAA